MFIQNAKTVADFKSNVSEHLNPDAFSTFVKGRLIFKKRTLNKPFLFFCHKIQKFPIGLRV